MKNKFPPVITAILLFLFSLIWTFFLLIAMNGVMEPEGTRALIVYSILTILTIVIFSAGNGYAVRFIAEKMKSVSPWIISTLFVAVCSVSGSVAIAIGSVIAMLSAGIK